MQGAGWQQSWVSPAAACSAPGLLRTGAAGRRARSGRAPTRSRWRARSRTWTSALSRSSRTTSWAPCARRWRRAPCMSLLSSDTTLKREATLVDDGSLVRACDHPCSFLPSEALHSGRLLARDEVEHSLGYWASAGRERLRRAPHATKGWGRAGRVRGARAGRRPHPQPGCAADRQEHPCAGPAGHPHAGCRQVCAHRCRAVRLLPLGGCMPAALCWT